MPTNNPQQQTSSQQTSKGATEGKSGLEGRIERGGERIERTVERVEKTAEHAASSAIDRVRQAREQATSGITQQRDMIADRVRRLGGVLRSGSETLSTDDPFAQNLLTTLGERVDGLADYISQATPNAIADDVQSFARRRPGVFFGGAFLLGLALGRFAKSSTGAMSGGMSGGEEDEGYAESDYEGSFPGQQGTGVTQARTTSVGGTGGTSGTGAAYGSQPGGGTSLPYVSAGSSSLGSSAGGAGASSSTGASGYGSTSGSTGYGSGSRAGQGASSGYGTSVGGTGGYGAGSSAPQGTSGQSASSGGTSGTGAQQGSGSSATPGTTAQPTERGQGSKS